jgi:hypothetical protein
MTTLPRCAAQKQLSGGSLVNFTFLSVCHSDLMGEAWFLVEEKLGILLKKVISKVHYLIFLDPSIAISSCVSSVHKQNKDELLNNLEKCETWFC